MYHIGSAARGGGIYISQRRPVYLEYETVNDQRDAIFCMNSSRQEIIQTFHMPYSILCGIAFSSDLYDRVNHSIWQCAVVEAKTGKTVCQKTFLGNDAGYYFPVLKFNHSVPVKKGEIYELHLRPQKVSEQSALGFFYSLQESAEEELLLNGNPVSGQLCFRIYGGDGSFWWSGLAILLSAFVVLFGLRLCRLLEKGKSWRKDRLLGCILIILCSFLMWSAFSSQNFYGDETAAIIEGMILSEGGVLYRDCVEQHMPVVSYLCAVFSWLGAETVQQFRLSWYLFLSVIWGGLYWRHAMRFGKRLFFLPFLYALLVPSGVVPYGYVLLGDGIEGICLIALFLEFLRYWEDQKLDWGRSAVLAACILGCVGTEFISLYALFAVFLFALCREIGCWKRRGFYVRKLIERYYKIAVLILVPVLIACIYFAANRALREMYEQAYRFNVDIYSQYVADGLGNNKIAPFILGFQQYFGCFTAHLKQVMSGQAEVSAFVRLALMFGTGFSVFSLFRTKKYGIAACLGICICLCSIRIMEEPSYLSGVWYSFHGQPAWGLMVLANALYLRPSVVKGGKLMTWGVLFTAVGIFVTSFCGFCLRPQSAVGELEHAVVELTDAGEAVFMDAYETVSPYLLYKKRYPVNRLLWMLPWYLDRYEQQTIDDLNTGLPRIVLFDESRQVWGYQDYFGALPDALRKKYIRFSDNEEEGWPYRIWMLTNPDG